MVVLFLNWISLVAPSACFCIKICYKRLTLSSTQVFTMASGNNQLIFKIQLTKSPIMKMRKKILMNTSLEKPSSTPCTYIKFRHRILFLASCFLSDQVCLVYFLMYCCSQARSIYFSTPLTSALPFGLITKFPEFCAYGCIYEDLVYDAFCGFPDFQATPRPNYCCC